MGDLIFLHDLEGYENSGLGGEAVIALTKIRKAKRRGDRITVWYENGDQEQIQFSDPESASRAFKERVIPVLQA